MTEKVRKDGYYLAACIDVPKSQTYLQSVYSKNGQLFFANTNILVPPEMVVEVFIDSFIPLCCLKNEMSKTLITTPT